jgi:hypothetical protein
MKYFRMSYEEVVFNRSYLNIILLNRSIPSYNTNIKDEPKSDSRKQRKPQKEYHKIDKSISANDFFMGLM